MHSDRPNKIANIKTILFPETEKCNNFRTMRCLTIHEVFFSNNIQCVRRMSYSRHTTNERRIKYSSEVGLQSPNVDTILGIPTLGYCWSQIVNVDRVYYVVRACDDIPFLFDQLRILSVCGKTCENSGMTLEISLQIWGIIVFNSKYLFFLLIS